MARPITVGAAQLGPIAADEARTAVVARLVALMRRAKDRGCDLVVYPELALTTFFPRWHKSTRNDTERWFEREMPSAETKPLFDLAAELGIGFCLGYAEATLENDEHRYYNSAVLVDGAGEIVGNYRKVHLPGHHELTPEHELQYSEKSWFSPGNLGFPTWRAFGGVAGMCICNDRRWPETFRVLGLRGAELVMLGFNTPINIPWVDDTLTQWHSQLCMQAAAYQNSYFVVGVGKTGMEEGSDFVGGTCIIAPTGEIIAQCAERGVDDLITATCDLDLCNVNRSGMLDFEANREPGAYGPITAQKGIAFPER